MRGIVDYIILTFYLSYFDSSIRSTDESYIVFPTKQVVSDLVHSIPLRFGG